MIVESEKTAFIMSCFYPQFVWLATGGCENMKDEKLNVLAGRTVDIIPDTDIADVLLGEAKLKE